MSAVVGLGKVGSAVADQFTRYPQYTVYKIRTGSRKGKSGNTYRVLKQSTPEAYENNCPSLKRFFKGIDGDVLFVVGGSELISAASLSILEQIKHCQIRILYIQPDLQFLSNAQQLNERAVRGVLQEYARSAVFERIYLIDVPLVAATLGDVPIRLYHARVYEAVVSTLHMITVFEHSEMVMGALYCPVEMARISTFGFVDSETDEEKLFFDLNSPREKSYYFGVNEERLRTDGALLGKVKERAAMTAHDNLRTSYAVYETQYENDYIYFMSHSSMVQP